MNQALPRVRPDNSTVSVIVPVYYNEDSLPRLFDELRQFEDRLRELRLRLELIFVDDGSGDNSFGLLMDFRQQRPATKVLKLSRNFGSPAAGRLAQRFVTGDCFLYLAADLQDPLDHVLDMLQYWMAGEHFVVSTRGTRDDPAATRFYAALYYRLVRLAITPDYPRNGIGLMLMDKIMLPLMADSPPKINLQMYAHWLGFHPKQLTYHRVKRTSGRSRWTFWRKFQYFIDTFTGFSPAPLRAMSALGLLIASLSVIYALIIFISALSGNIPVTGFAALAILISLFGGCILFMLGVMGEYLWRIFIQVSGRPDAIIEELHV